MNICVECRHHRSKQEFSGIKHYCHHKSYKEINKVTGDISYTIPCCAVNENGKCRQYSNYARCIERARRIYRRKSNNYYILIAILFSGLGAAGIMVLLGKLINRG